MANEKFTSSRKSIYLTDMEWALAEKISEERNCSVNAFFRSLLDNYIFIREFRVISHIKNNEVDINELINQFRGELYEMKKTSYDEPRNEKIIDLVKALYPSTVDIFNKSSDEKIDVDLEKIWCEPKPTKRLLRKANEREE